MIDRFCARVGQILLPALISHTYETMRPKVRFELPPKRHEYTTAQVINTTPDLDDENVDEEELLSIITADRERKKVKIKFLILCSLSTILATLFLIFKLVAFERKILKTFTSIQHPAYEIISHHHLNEYNADFVMYYHKKTRAEVLVYLPTSMDSQMGIQDKVFGISFRTKPTDNTGVPHILEHSVLSGSKKYPVKEPFLYLLKGSLHTFLNAMTYNDRTVYPVASRNSQDFFNLMSVYLDAVFAPLCVEQGNEWILQKEGWRYEFGEKDETTQRRNVQYKGVVYSEMKGVYSDAESFLQRKSEAFLFPDNTYHFDSGGDPQFIPTLSYENFTSFYHRHYHPTNSKIFISGDPSDIIEALNKVDSSLSKYSSSRSSRDNSVILFQPKIFLEPLYEKLPYSVNEITEEGQHMFVITWLLNDQHLDTKTELAFIVLDQLLIGNPSSVLRRSLESSQLGSSIIGGGLSTGLLQMTYSVGMKGLRDENVAALKSLIFKVLADTIESGFHGDDIAAAINSLEFSLREASSSSSSAGVSIFLSALTKWNYDKHPILALIFETSLRELKAEVAESGSSYFISLVQKYFLLNNHYVQVELYPSTSLEGKVAKDEEDRLQSISSAWTDEQYSVFLDQDSKFRDIQNTPDSPESIGTIPRIQLADVPQRNIEYPVIVEKFDTDTSGVIVLKSDVISSNGILYVDIGFDVSSVAYADIILLPVFVRMLKEAGSDDLYRSIGINTGGINVQLLLQPVLPYDSQVLTVSVNKNMRVLLFIRGKCLREKFGSLLVLVKQILLESNLNDMEKFIQIVSEEKSDLLSNIISRGNGYALKRIQSRYDTQSFISDKLTGIRYANSLDEILSEARTKWNEMHSRLMRIRQDIIAKYPSDIIFSLTGLAEDMKNTDDAIIKFCNSFPRTETKAMINFRKETHPWIFQATDEMISLAPFINEGFEVPSQISFVGKGGIAYGRGERVTGSASVIKQYLDSGFLWETVRAKNGAYGVFSSLNSWDGTFIFVSYRDPNLILTLEAYDQAAISITNDVNSGAVTDEVISTAIIGAIGNLDAKSFSPSEIGWRSMLWWLSGSSADYRLQVRQEILGTVLSDFAAFANRLQKLSNVSLAVVASEFSIESAIESGRNFTIINIP